MVNNERESCKRTDRIEAAILLPAVAILVIVSIIVAVTS